MSRFTAWLALAVALLVRCAIPIPALAADTGGPIFRDTCTLILSPVTNRVLCWEQTTTILKYWNGSAWINTTVVAGVSALNGLTGAVVILGAAGDVSVSTSSPNITLDLVSTAVAPGAYGSATQSPSFTVDAKGRLTAAANATITPAFSSLTGAASCGQLPALTGDLTSSGCVTTLASVVTAGGPVGDATHTPQITFDAKGRLTTVTSVLITGTPPGGSAGGDLTGTYPNPTVAKVNAVAYPASPSTNTVPVVTGANTVTYEAVPSAALNLTTTACSNQFVTAISVGGVGTCTTDTLAGAQHANQGTTTTVLHGNAAGNPTWAAVVSADLNLTPTTCSNQFIRSLSASAVGTCATVANTDLANSSIAVTGTASQVTVSGSPVSLGGTVTLSLPATINVNTSGNAATSTALAADPADCSVGTVSMGINAAGVCQGTAFPTVTALRATGVFSGVAASQVWLDQASSTLSRLIAFGPNAATLGKINLSTVSSDASLNGGGVTIQDGVILGTAGTDPGTGKINLVGLQVSGVALASTHLSDTATLVRTTDTGSVTNTMLAGSIDLATKVTGVLPGANGGTGVANSAKTITLGGNLVTSGAFATTFTVTGTTGVTFPTSGTLLANSRTINTTSPITGGGDLSADRTFACATCGVTGSPLSQFAATTSAQLLGVISDETGTGALVFANTPALVTPAIGAATGTSLTLTGGVLTATFSQDANSILSITNASTASSNARARVQAISGTVTMDLQALGSLGLGLVGTLSNHDLALFANNAVIFNVSARGSFRPEPFTFANIGTVLTTNGDMGYCSNCTIANPCAGAGTGAFAKRLNGVNVCN